MFCCSQISFSSALKFFVLIFRSCVENFLLSVHDFDGEIWLYK